MTKRSRFQSWRDPALVALPSLAFQLPFFDRWYSAMDEGHMLQYADIVAAGDPLYREAASYPLPGAFYLLALAFRLGEPSILLARWLVAIEFALFAALALVLLRGLVRPAFAVGGVALLWLYRVWAFPHWQIYNYSTTALVVLLLALLLLVRFFETSRRGWLAAAGFVLGLGIFCKQDYGAAAFAAMAIGLAAHAHSAGAGAPSFMRLFAVLTLPAAGVGLAAALHFLQQGVLADVVRMTLLNPFVAVSHYDYMEFPSPLPLFRQDAALRSGAGFMAYLPSIILSTNFAVVNHWLYRDTALVDTAAKLFVYGPWLVFALGLARLLGARGALREAERRLRYLRELLLFGFGTALVALVFLRPPRDYLHLAVVY